MPYVGSMLDFVSSQYGFLLCIILPLFALFIYQIYRFIVVIIEEKNASTKQKAEDKQEQEDNKKTENIEEKSE